MHILIIAVGKIKEKYLQEGIAEYTKRLRPYVKLNLLELTEEKRPAPATSSIESAAMEMEGKRILAVVPEGSFVIALDVKGQGWSSEELAASFRQWELAGKNQITFVIGGDLGLTDTVIARSNHRLSLSLMTFTHQMIRLIILEQIYRACKINHHEPYHK